LRVKAAVCVNKFDINPGMADEIGMEAELLGLPVVGRIHYNPAVTRAQVKGTTIIEEGESLASKEIRGLWASIQRLLVDNTPIPKD
jgi:MinD superfamily P-loop ATPase